MNHSVLPLIFISREIDQNTRKILRSFNPIVTVSVGTLFSSNFTSVCAFMIEFLDFCVCFLSSNYVKRLL